MFIVQLKFSSNKAYAPRLMQAHKAWIDRGFEDGVFLVTGSLQPNLGGAIVAHNTTLGELQERVSDDPFVAEKVVEADIVELSASRTDARLAFLREA